MDREVGGLATIYEDVAAKAFRVQPITHRKRHLCKLCIVLGLGSPSVDLTPINGRIEARACFAYPIICSKAAIVFLCKVQILNTGQDKYLIASNLVYKTLLPLPSLKNEQ